MHFVFCFCSAFLAVDPNCSWELLSEALMESLGNFFWGVVQEKVLLSKSTISNKKSLDVHYLFSSSFCEVSGRYPGV